MLQNGFVKIDRKIISWRWYHDSNTFRLFFHLIMTANYEDKAFENIVVKRGQRVASRATLATETGMSEQNVRTALKHLESTNEITVDKTSKYSVITVNNYGKYQEITNTLTNNPPTTNQQLTNNQPTTNHNERKIKKDKNDKKEKKDIASPTCLVCLSENDFSKLSDEYGKEVIDKYCEKIRKWQEKSGKTVSDPADIIRKWLVQDEVSKLSGIDKYKEFINVF